MQKTPVLNRVLKRKWEQDDTNKFTLKLITTKPSRIVQNSVKKNSALSLEISKYKLFSNASSIDGSFNPGVTKYGEDFQRGDFRKKFSVTKKRMDLQKRSSENEVDSFNLDVSKETRTI